MSEIKVLPIYNGLRPIDDACVEVHVYRSESSDCVVLHGRVQIYQKILAPSTTPTEKLKSLVRDLEDNLGSVLADALKYRQLNK